MTDYFWRKKKQDCQQWTSKQEWGYKGAMLMLQFFPPFYCLALFANFAQKITVKEIICILLYTNPRRKSYSQLTLLYTDLAIDYDYLLGTDGTRFLLELIK